jgi:metal-responsive CopG/Arc/MetJ family transcriptional regulator
MRTRTFNIALPEQLVKALDRQAREEARSRSEVIRAAALAYLEWGTQWRSLQAYGRRQTRRLSVRPADIEHLVSETRRQRLSR